MRASVSIGLSLAILFSVTGSAGAVDAIDREWEEGIARQLEQRNGTGEIIRVEAGRHSFLALLNEPLTSLARGAVILLHGMGAHPDWPVVIFPLRTVLPESGWLTLSIQLPLLAPQTAVAEYGNTVEEAMLRINASIQLLRDRGYDRIVLLGYSFGAAIGARYLAQNSNNAIAGMIAISIQARKFLNPTLSVLDQIERITVPFLDIYGSRDNAEIMATVVDRRLAARKADNRAYQQVEITHADHAYSGAESRLVEPIRDWLEKLEAERMDRDPDEREPDTEATGSESAPVTE